MGGVVYKSELTGGNSAENLSVVIITLNEEHNLRSLLSEIPKGAEIILVDSGSTDQTVHLAKSRGAKVEFRSFDNYAAQKNFALNLASKRWTLCLDADERPDKKLWNEIIKVTEQDPFEKGAYSVRRDLVFLGQPLKFGRTHDKVTRLFPSHGAKYENEIHEKLVFASSPTPPQLLAGSLLHFSYRDLGDYFTKFNRYTTMMANARFSKRKVSPPGLILALRIPADFFVRYVARLGFLDGWHGFLWAALGSFYGFVKYAKLRELYRESAKNS